MSEHKILVIDDSKVFLMYLKNILGKIPNVSVRTIQDSREALSAIIEFKPDIVLTDFEMPHLNGNEICQMLKANEVTSLIPIMMLTSTNTDDQLINAIECGADEFICKSSTKEVISIKIKSMIRYKKLMDADIKSKQIEAVKALIATSNHEFNNALCISNGFIRKLQKKSRSKDAITIIEKIQSMNDRMLAVVQKLENLQNITLEGSHKEIKMLKL